MSFIRFLHLPHVRIQNANALSSPFTIGFPAMTAWLGFMHALQRKLNEQGFSELDLLSVAVVSHHCNLQTHKGVGDYVYSIINTSNPLDKDGSRSAFIEEPRCHLDVSLLIEYEASPEENDNLNEADFIDSLSRIITTMKIAGGDIIDFKKPAVIQVDKNDDIEFNKMLRKLMPGYVLIERRELMEDAMVAGMDALDALLEYLTVHHECIKEDSGDSFTWRSQRKTSGWIVPIATGFQGISALGQAKNQRDPDVPHCFAESVVTLGEFVMPHKIKYFQEILWKHHVDLDNQLYLCQQDNSN